MPQTATGRPSTTEKRLVATRSQFKYSLIEQKLTMPACACACWRASTTARTNPTAASAAATSRAGRRVIGSIDRAGLHRLARLLGLRVLRVRGLHGGVLGGFAGGLRGLLRLVGLLRLRALRGRRRSGESNRRAGNAHLGRRAVMLPSHSEGPTDGGARSRRSHRATRAGRPGDALPRLPRPERHPRPGEGEGERRRADPLESRGEIVENELLQFVRGAQEAGVPLEIVYDARQRWQALSFDALRRALRPLEAPGSGPTLRFLESQG